jgi:hypothetical protein
MNGSSSSSDATVERANAETPMLVDVDLQDPYPGKLNKETKKASKWQRVPAVMKAASQLAWSKTMRLYETQKRRAQAHLASDSLESVLIETVTELALNPSLDLAVLNAGLRDNQARAFMRLRGLHTLGSLCASLKHPDLVVQTIRSLALSFGRSSMHGRGDNGDIDGAQSAFVPEEGPEGHRGSGAILESLTCVSSTIKDRVVGAYFHIAQLLLERVKDDTSARVLSVNQRSTPQVTFASF